MRPFCLRHDYVWFGEFTATTTNLVNGKENPTEKHEIICKCAKCGKEKSFKFKKIRVDK